MDIEVNGTRLHYTLEPGAGGPPVVLLHGYTLDRRYWEPQLPVLANRNQMLVPDLRGFGDSPLGSVEVNTPDLMAEDVRGLLDRVAVREPLVLAGLSMGGYVALAFMARYPERVRALILADTRAPGDDENQRRARRALADQVEREKSTLAAREAIFPLLMAPAGYDNPELVARVRAMAARPAPAAIAATLRGLAVRADQTALLARIEVPTLIVVGELDALTPPNDARVLHAGIPNSELIELPGIGHLSSLEAPLAFNAAVISFLDRHRLHG